jgi:gluconate 2-dehydrogenase gamma chain
MNRREFLQCAAVLVSGVSSAAKIPFAFSEEQWDFIATRDNYINQPVDLFDERQRALCAAIAETIIPRTETPGAIDAGVPKFIELIAQDWYTNDERERFLQGISELDDSAQQQHNASFDTLLPAQQIAMLEAAESAASDSSWYALGGALTGSASDVPFICQIKELTAWGFFTSEVGMTQVLRYDPMPMKMNPDIPLRDDDSSWATRVGV